MTTQHKALMWKGFQDFTAIVKSCFFERRQCHKIESAIARHTKSGLNTPFIF
ncbi:hypothetical protein QUB43_03305 [Microcoleus sp. A6-D4]